MEVDHNMDMKKTACDVIYPEDCYLSWRSYRFYPDNVLQIVKSETKWPKILEQLSIRFESQIVTKS